MTNKPNIIPISILFFVLLSLSHPARAQWTHDSTVNTQICTATGSQRSTVVVNDGSGGAIMAWTDDRNGNDDIFVQRINKQGILQWASNAVTVTNLSSIQYAPYITDDGSGGAIIAWMDLRNGNSDLYAQRVNNNGSIKWTVNGIPVSIASSNQVHADIKSDGQGGAFITWEDYRNGNSDIYAQHINNNGINQWATDGIPICTTSGLQYLPRVISNDSGGAIFVWEDLRGGSYDIYGQKVNSNGIPQWTTNGITICTAWGDQNSPVLTRDGNGGAIIAWNDRRSATYDIYAQRINSSGVIQWVVDGVGVCTDGQNQNNVTISSDELGGAYLAWSDQRPTTPGYYVQRIDNSGQPLWLLNGIQIGATSNVGYAPEISHYRLGGIVMVWNSANSIFSQCVSSDGTTIWKTGGKLVHSSSSTAGDLGVVTDDSANTIAIWNDYRFGRYKVFAQNVNHEGYLGVASKFSVTSKWNMVSVPMPVADYTTTAIFPTASSLAFGFNAGYSSVTALSKGKGYWLKFNEAQSIGITGTIRNRDTIQVISGWNMIGSISSIISISQITSIPPGMVTSQFYKYNGGYIVADSIEPGKGYWVRVNQAGALVLSSGVVANLNATLRIVPTTENPPSPPLENSSVSETLPTQFALEQNYPNPFNPSTMIHYQLPVNSFVTLKVYNTLGQEVTTLVQGMQDAGYQSVRFTSSNLPGGVYLYKLQAGNFRDVKKLILMK